MGRDIEKIERIAQQTISLLRKRIPIIQAYLFGSHVDGMAHESSDIDIAAFSPEVGNMPLEVKTNLIVSIERQIDAPVELHLFSEKNLAEARPTNFFGYLQTQGKQIQ